MTGTRLGIAFALLVTVALAVAHLTAWHDFDENVDATTVVLLAIGIGLLFAVIAPHATRIFFERMTSLKLPGGVEIGLQAVERAERVQGGLFESIEDLSSPTDDVSVEGRPLEGGTSRQFEAVRETLEARLRFVHTVVLNQPTAKEGDYPKVLAMIEAEGLLRHDEAALVRDLLGRAEDDIKGLPFELRTEFLDASWRFAVRFATLAHERLVRRRLAHQGWVLLDFEQDRSHRPDFLAHREGVWFLVAARVQPNKLFDTRRRLARCSPPFGAKPVIVIPDRRSFAADGRFGGVEVIKLGALLTSWNSRDASRRRRRARQLRRRRY